MKKDIHTPTVKTLKAMAFSLSFLTLSLPLSAYAQQAYAPNYGVVPTQKPRSFEQSASLRVMRDSIPQDMVEKLYNSQMSQEREISPFELTGDSYYAPARTIVSAKIDGIKAQFSNLKNRMSTLSETFETLHTINEGRSAEYFAAIATINTQLQAGTTPGNPRLVERLRIAENNLEQLAKGVNEMNQVAMRASQIQSETNVLADEIRSTFRISGAIEEDHVRLSILEDELENTHVVIDRILNNVSDDITRLSAYMSAERANIRTLSLAVANGDLYGRSLAGRPFSNVAAFNEPQSPEEPPQLVDLTPETVAGDHPDQPMPLVKIRFNKPNVEYEQPIYSALNEALSRYPNAQFDLVAVHPSRGNAAQVAIESTRARRNAEKVLRAISEMGLPPQRVNLSYNESAQATSTEVHIFVR